MPYDFIHEGMSLLNLFDADISGRDFEHGKPHPIIFYGTAGAWLPARALFVVEEASSGVQAGEMAVLGVARLAPTLW